MPTAKVRAFLLGHAVCMPRFMNGVLDDQRGDFGLDVLQCPHGGRAGRYEKGRRTWVQQDT